MFDRVGARLRAVRPRPIETALGALGQVVARVAAGDGRRAARARAIRSGRRRRCGRASTGWRRSRPARRRPRPDLFDWDAIARTAIDAMLRGLAARRRDPGPRPGARPERRSVTLVEFDRNGGELGRQAARAATATTFVGDVPDGTVYGLVAEGDGAALRPVEGAARPVGHRGVVPARPRPRSWPTQRGVDNAGRGPLAVARAPRPAAAAAARRRAARRLRGPRPGLTRRPGRRRSPARSPRSSTELPRLAALGVTVVELLPVHQNDPQEGSYWGYMPLAFGAVHRQYAAGDDAAAELADVRRRRPRPRHRGVARRRLQPHDRGRRRDRADVQPARPRRRLVLPAPRATARTSRRPAAATTSTSRRRSPRTSCCWSLDRLADLGVDGFRFDLAAVLAHDRDVHRRRSTAWAPRRGVVHGRRAVGRRRRPPARTGVAGRRAGGTGTTRFREDGRGFLRAEPGLVPAMVQRVQGSPDLVAAPLESVNFLACHDGFTLYDLVAYDRKHNEANGWGGTDGSGDNRSWNCGWEGDDGAPAEVARAAPAPAAQRVVPADDVARHADGRDGRRVRPDAGRQQQRLQPGQRDVVVRLGRGPAEFADLERFCGELARAAPPPPGAVAAGLVGRRRAVLRRRRRRSTTRPSSRSLAWSVGGLYVIANAWWEPLRWTILPAGPWRRVVDTSLPSPDDIVPAGVPARRPRLRRRPALRRHPRTRPLTLRVFDCIGVFAAGGHPHETLAMQRNTRMTVSGGR